MKQKELDYSKRTLIIIGIIALIFTFVLTSSILFALRTNEDVYSENDVSNINDEDDNTKASSLLINDYSSDINVNNEVSDVISDEIEHGWIINEFGYTYVYGDSGFQQFNYKQSSLQRYVDCMNGMSTLIPKEANLYNIIVPVSTTFADIPREVYREDNFFNLSQSSFVATVGTRLDDKYTNISIVNDLETAFDNGENVYFRTDSNWTSLGAYKGYLSFCKTVGKEPMVLDSFPMVELGDFLGCFYKSTSSEVMYNNPDQFVCYSYNPDISVVMTVYDGDMVLPDYKLCNNRVDIGTMYSYYLGREAGRYSISTNSDSGSLLIIGDSSVAPILPFLVSHYKEIEYINPFYCKNNLTEILSKYKFDNVITMCYSTNAVSGNYIPSLMNFSGVQAYE